MTTQTVAAARSDIPEGAVYLVRPRAFVKSGVPASDPGLQLRVFSFRRAPEVEVSLAHSLKLVDDARQPVAFTVHASLDESSGGYVAAIVPASRLASNRWYTLVVAASDEVILDDLGNEWKVDFYTGRMLQIAEVERGEGEKADQLYVKMTERTRVDRAWAARLFADESGRALPGCVQFNGRCSRAGTFEADGFAVLLNERGAGKRVSFASGLDREAGPIARARMRLHFEPCQRGTAECARW